MTYTAELQVGRRHVAVDVGWCGYLAGLCEYLLELQIPAGELNERQVTSGSGGRDSDTAL